MLDAVTIVAVTVSGCQGAGVPTLGKKGTSQGSGVGHGLGVGQGLGRGVGQGLGLGVGQGLGLGMGQGFGLGHGLGFGVGQGFGLGVGAGLFWALQQNPARHTRPGATAAQSNHCVHGMVWHCQVKGLHQPEAHWPLKTQGQWSAPGPLQLWVCRPTHLKLTHHKPAVQSELLRHCSATSPD